MSEDPSPTEGEELQFDRVTSSSSNPDGATAVVCSTCQTSIRTAYFDVDGAPTCGRCKVAVEMREAAGRGWGSFFKSGALGLLAAIAGAILYYAVIAITELEIGLVAIVIGFMVGWAVRRGARGNGGRRFQVLALVLTYFSVGLAYAPLAVKTFYEGIKERTSADSTATGQSTDSLATDTRLLEDTVTTTIDATSSAVASDTVTSTSGGKIGFGFLLVGIGGILLFVFALPVIVIFGSLPGGLISALIIGFGMHQAWRMTGARKSEITGPFKVNVSPTAESAA
jgi:hypothetical protein